VSPKCTAVLAVLVLAGAGMLAPWTSSQTASSQPTGDLPVGAMRAKATAACTECHEVRIILQQRLSKATWTREVDKMTKWGALVDASDRDALIDYLSANFGPDGPPYQPSRSAPQKLPKDR
jgi:hypothetical protein